VIIIVLVIIGIGIKNRAGRGAGVPGPLRVRGVQQRASGQPGRPLVGFTRAGGTEEPDHIQALGSK
jgi:hypothetical protein